MSLTTQQTVRYSRQMIIDEIGEEGQHKFLQSRVLVIGAGGLGSPALYYLAAAGIGTLGIVDYDLVELSNLQRQILFTEDDLKQPKVEVAQKRLKALNPEVNIEPHFLKLDDFNAEKIISSYDVIVDATDSFASKFLVNDTCVKVGRPLVHGAIMRLSGQVLTWKPGHACFRCIFKEAPEEGTVPTCQQAGVLGSIAGLIGSVQSAEVVKLILGKGELLLNRMFIADIWTMKTRTVEVLKDNNCRTCG